MKKSKYKYVFLKMKGVTLAVALCLVLITFFQASAQLPIGIGTRYSNSFKEWIITTDDEDVRGELRLRWTFGKDWSSWDFEIGDYHGTIDQKWEGEPDLWEIRCDGVIVNARTAWRGEYYRWKLNDGTHQYNWFPHYANQPNDWSTDEGENGFFQLYTYYDGDSREWVVKDELPDDVSMAMRMALIFLALHFSTPRI